MEILAAILINAFIFVIIVASISSFIKKQKLVYQKSVQVDETVIDVRILVYTRYLFFRMTQILVRSKGAMPRMLLDSNDTLGALYSERHIEKKLLKEIDIDGQSEKSFKLFVFDDTKIESLQFLTPDILSFFIEHFPDFDILFEGGVVDMRRNGRFSLAEVDVNMEYLAKKIHRIYKYWSTQDKVDFVYVDKENTNS